jgi:2-polyprenyl-6-methoxyphenol hydroxylase-like FAD-dependent oxidoreductase
VIETRCCIAGGGPAGMMLGVLLARAGVDTVVLEKHGDFLRDFRGDTVHPSTLQLIHELGWLDEFLRRPHQELTQLGAQIGDEHLDIVDFTHLPTACRFVALMPQWEFLDFLAERGRRYPTFHLMMASEATELVRDGERIAGLRVTAPTGPLEVRADLTVAADGRSSRLRQQAGLIVEDIGAPIDVLWLRLPRRPGDADQTLGYLRQGHMLVTLQRGDYWQCAFVIRKGGYDATRAAGLAAFRATIAQMVPFLADRVGELRSWDDIRLLTVKIDRLRDWQREGLLCIGDAAHAMSPIGGVGINLAVQDAVAAANALVEPLTERALTLPDLQSVQRRRTFATRATQRLQVLIQDRIISRALDDGPPASLPLFARLLRDHASLRRIPARLLGLGFTPEHIRTPDVHEDLRSG